MNIRHLPAISAVVLLAACGGSSSKPASSTAAAAEQKTEAPTHESAGDTANKSAEPSSAPAK